MANLPGANLPNTPTLPNTTPDSLRPAVPASWDDIQRIAAEVFDVLREKGQPAAEALLAEIKRLRAS